MSSERQALAKAHSLVALNRWEDALGLLGPALADSSTVATAQCLRAQCLLGLDQPRAARQAAELALAAAPDDEWAHRLRALALLGTGRGRQALGAAREAVRLAPDSVPALNLLASVQLRRGAGDEAKKTAAAALAADPHDALAHLTVGTVAVADHDWDAAEVACREGLRLDPENSDLAIALATVIKGSGRRDEAAQVYLAAARSDPTDARARHGLARLGVPLLAVGWFGKFVIFQAARIIIGNGGRPTFVAALLAAGLAAGALITTLLRVSGTRGLPEPVRIGLRGEHVNAALGWLKAAAIAAIAVGIWSFNISSSDGGGIGFAVGCIAFAVIASLLARLFRVGPRASPRAFFKRIWCLRPHRPSG